MNTGITLIEVRQEAMDAIQAIKNGNLDIKQATEIKNLLNTIIETAKVQVNFLNALPKSIREKLDQDSIKAIAGTLRDRDAELDEVLNEIEKNKTYDLSKE